jgi:hypothetical protein
MRQSILRSIVKPADCILAFGIPTSREDFLKDLESENKDFAGTIPGKWPQYEVAVMRVLQEFLPAMRDLGVHIVHRLTIRDFGNLFRESSVKAIVLFTHWKEVSNHTCFTQKEYLEFLEGHPDFLKWVSHSPELLAWVGDRSEHLKSLVESRQAELKAVEKPPLVVLRDGEIHADYDKIVDSHLKDLEVETYLEMLKHSRTSEIEFFDGMHRLYDIVMQIPTEFYGILDLNVCQCQDLVYAVKKSRPYCHVRFMIDRPKACRMEGVRPDFMLYFYWVFFNHLKRKSLPYLEALQEVVAAFYEIFKKNFKRRMP